MLSTAAQGQEVVVHPSFSESTISRNVLRAIFGMRMRTWEDGTPITVFVLDDRSPLHSSFSKTQLNVFSHQLRQAWDRLVFSGTGQAPVTVSSEEEMRSRVASTPGAIGYLPRELVDESVRLLQIR
jgi:ABC-type phosphate transport system substrate-binding protein